MQSVFLPIIRDKKAVNYTVFQDDDGERFTFIIILQNAQS